MMSALIEILAISIRKCMINGKGIGYLPVMVESEAKNYMFREAVNEKSRKILERRRNDVLSMQADPMQS